MIAVIGIIAAILLISIIIWIIHGNTTITVTEIKIESEKIPESFHGFRIAQISDLHNAEFGKENERLLSKIKDTEPDIIVVTGDVMDSRRTDVDVAVAFMNNAAQIAPVYYVVGNHETRIPEEYEQFIEGIKNESIHVLSDETVTLVKGEDSITLIGMQSGMQDNTTYTDELLSNLKSICDETEGYKMVLAHKPDYFDDYAECKADLVFCGHAHGGQFRLPIIGALIAPGQGWFPEHTEGVYTKDETSMIVSRGLGNSLFPFRINNSPEIVVAELSGEE